MSKIDWNLDISRYHCANHIWIDFSTIITRQNIEQVRDTFNNVFQFMNSIQVGINFDNVPNMFCKFVFVRIIILFRYRHSHVTEARHGGRVLCVATTLSSIPHM